MKNSKFSKGCGEVVCQVPWVVGSLSTAYANHVDFFGLMDRISTTDRTNFTNTWVDGDI